MYGYLRPLKSPHHDYTLFRAHYCCLCKTIQSEYGLPFRAGLSYEMAFFALLLNALQGADVSIRRETCLIHPFRKQAVFKSSPTMSLCAHLNMALLAGKLSDDIADEERFRPARRIGLRYLESRAGDVFKGYSRLVSDAYESIRLLEEGKTDDVDAISAVFGELLASLFLEVSAGSGLEPPEPMIHFSRVLGRWVYCIDALDDLQNDFRAKRYNPLIYRYKETLLSSDSLEKAYESIGSQEAVRLRLLSEHIMSEYRLFRMRLGLYSVEIDDIIFRTIPCACARIAKKNVVKEKK